MLTVIKGTTSLFVLLGNPVAHSLSPAIHNRAFHLLSMDCCYIALPVAPESLAEALEGLKALGIKGANITVPHKESIIPLVDTIDEWGLKIGAVNTLVISRDAVSGFNTDAMGFIQAWMEEAGVPIANTKCLILGAGGSARAVYAALAGEKAEHIAICARNTEKAEGLHHHFSPYFQGIGKSTIVMQDHQSIRTFLKECDIVINCTPLGMIGNQDVSPLPCPEALKKETIVYDLVYNPKVTGLLQSAARQGCRTINGFGMLIQQGALAFQLWTGKPFPTEAVKRYFQENSFF